MRRSWQVATLSSFTIIGIICAVYADSFTYVQTSSGIRIGPGGDPGAKTLRFSEAGGVIKFTGNGSLLSDDGALQVDTRDGGYLKSTTGLSVTRAMSNGRAYLQGKPVSGQYAMTQAHYDGSVYSTSKTGACITADADGSAWMTGSGLDNFVTANADGSTNLSSSAGSSVTATGTGDVVIQLGQVPQQQQSMAPGGGMETLSEAEALTEEGLAAQERAERVLAIRQEADEEGI